MATLYLREHSRSFSIWLVLSFNSINLRPQLSVGKTTKGATLTMTEAPGLELEPREILGKKVKRLRREGIVPVHLYGQGIASRALQCERSKLVRALAQAGEGKPITISIVGETGPLTVTAREVQWNPRNDHLLHVDFFLTQ